MEEYRGVWVFVEHEGGKIARVSKELLGKGSELASSLGQSLAAVLIGYEVKSLAEDLFAHGAEEVYLCEHEELKSYRTMPYTRVLSQLVELYTPNIILFGATTMGRDLAPRLAARIQTGLTADCTDLRIEDHTDPVTGKTYPKLLYQIRPAFGGNIIATIVSPYHRPQMATVRSGVMRALPPDPNRKGKIIVHQPTFDAGDMRGAVIEKVMGKGEKVNLEDAKVIVSGGTGVSKDPGKGFALIRELAELLGGEVGASRKAVEAGYIDRSHQVGQTGTSVRPRLYIACGISGSVQHLAGMHESENIVAINPDPRANIFNYSHFCIVGDLFEELPKLIEKVKKLKGF